MSGGREAGTKKIKKKTSNLINSTKKRIPLPSEFRHPTANS